MCRNLLFQFQFQVPVIQDIQFHQRKMQFAIQLRPWKVYLAIQFWQWKGTKTNSHIHGRNFSEISKELCQHMAETPESNWNSVSGSNLQSLSITDLPLTQEKVESTYADVFQGLGKFPGEPYKLRLKPDAVPVKHRPRKVPVHLQDGFHEEVERLVKIDVLEPVTEPTELVNSFVIVEKVIDSSNAHSPNHSIKKSIRLCIDPKDLNEALEREPYYSRTIDELISMFAGAKVFTIVDMDKGYWQVVLHPESRKLTCMAFDIAEAIHKADSQCH